MSDAIENPTRATLLAIGLATLAITALFIGMIWDFLIALLLAAIFSAMAAPLQAKVLPIVGGRSGVAAAITLFILLLCVLLPILAITYVAAVEARPRVAIAMSSRGTDIGISQALTYKGDAVIHDDAETKAWFYPALAARVRPLSEDAQAAFVSHLDTEGRVVIEVVPDVRIGFDAEEMFKGSPAGSTQSHT